jgi:dinuclear metal center YbgI/SA1388 family protein
MLSREKVVQYFNKLLQPELFKDSTYNGLQVEGSAKITRVAFAVDSSLENFRKAVSLKCEMLVVHHGTIWGGLKKIAGSERERFAFLLKNDLNLYVSHLPLDNHPALGNNARIVKELKAKTLDKLGEAGLVCELRKALSFEEFLAGTKALFGGAVRHLHYGEEKIRKIAVCSGAVKLSFLSDALEAGARTVLTGEGMGESMFRDFARENGMDVLFAGHTETETPGIRALMEQFRKDHKNRAGVVWIGNE